MTHPTWLNNGPGFGIGVQVRAIFADLDRFIYFIVGYITICAHDLQMKAAIYFFVAKFGVVV